MARFKDGVKGAAIDNEAWRAFAGDPKPKARKKGVKGISDARFLEVLDEVKEKLAAGAWGTATGIHFVALFADLYFRVYQVAPDDLSRPPERAFATKLANDMLRGDFAGDADAMAKFVAWTWTRERRTEAWRREDPVARSGRRLSWRVQFSRAILSDFRVAEARAKATKKEAR